MKQSSLTLKEIFKGIQDDQVKMNYIVKLLSEYKNVNNDFDFEKQEALHTGLLRCIPPLLENLQFANTSEMPLLQEIFSILDKFLSNYQHHDTAPIDLLRAITSRII